MFNKINFISISFLIFLFCQSLNKVTSKSDYILLRNKPIVANSIYSNGIKSNIAVEKLNKKISCDSGSLYVYILDPDTTGTNIRNKPRGKSILKVFQRGEADVHFVVITKANNGWFKINGPIYGSGDDKEIKIPGGSGWIHGSVIFADTKTPLDGHNYLYLTSSAKSKIVYEIKNPYSRVRLLDICGEWVKIEYKGVKGWIESVRLCGYYYTTCA